MNKSPFNTLPYELRAMIFRLVLNPPEGVPVLLDIFPDSETLQSASIPNANFVLALSRACRQFRSETAHLTYGKNTFNVYSTDLVTLRIKANTPGQQIVSWEAEDDSQNPSIALHKNREDYWTFDKWRETMELTDLGPASRIEFVVPALDNFCHNYVEGIDNRNRDLWQSEILVNSVLATVHNLHRSYYKVANDVAVRLRVNFSLDAQPLELNHLAPISLSLKSVDDSKNSIKQATGDRSRELYAAWKTEVLDTKQYSNMQVELQKCRSILERLASGFQKKQ